MKHVGADDKIERAELEALFRGGFFKIKNPSFNFGEVRELLMRAGEESSGDVGECVGVQAALQRREHLRAEAASTGADFEDPQAAALRKHTGRFLHSSADSCKPVTCQQTVAVKLVEQFRSSASEQYLHRVLLAAQNRTELSAISGHQLRFREVTGVIRNELFLRLVSGFSGSCEGQLWSITGFT